MFDPRLLRAKKGAPALTPAIGSPTLVCADAIAPPSAGGGALDVLLPPMKGSLPAGMATLIWKKKKKLGAARGAARARTDDTRVHTYCSTASARRTYPRRASGAERTGAHGRRALTDPAAAPVARWLGRES